MRSAECGVRNCRRRREDGHPLRKKCFKPDNPHPSCGHPLPRPWARDKLRGRSETELTKRMKCMNRLWMWLLFKLEELVCALLRAAQRREKVRIFKRHLKRLDAWKN